MVLLLPPAPVVNAAALTAKSDTLSTLAASTVANHDILFTTPTGITAGQTITVTFPAGWTMGSVAFGDMDLLDDAVDVTLAAICTTTTWGVAVAGQVITFTSCTGTMAAASVVRIKIGTNATGGTNKITNPTAGSQTISLAAGGDTGDIVVNIIADDSVDVTATVPASLIFTVTGTSLEFGTLSTSASTWADASAGSTTAVVGTTLEAGTNSTSGYAITINGATIASTGTPADTITAMATEAVLATASEQFGIRITSSGGSGVVDTVYDNTAADTYALVTADFPDTIAACATQSATTTYSVYYAANIASNTEAHIDYTTTLTYVATGNF